MLRRLVLTSVPLVFSNVQTMELFVLAVAITTLCMEREFSPYNDPNLSGFVYILNWDVVLLVLMFMTVDGGFVKQGRTAWISVGAFLTIFHIIILLLVFVRRPKRVLQTVIRIRGAPGQHGGKINGVYERVVGRYNREPCWRKESGLWLVMGADRRWQLNDLDSEFNEEESDGILKVYSNHDRPSLSATFMNPMREMNSRPGCYAYGLETDFTEVTRVATWKVRTGGNVDEESSWATVEIKESNFTVQKEIEELRFFYMCFAGLVDFFQPQPQRQGQEKPVLSHARSSGIIVHNTEMV